MNRSRRTRDRRLRPRRPLRDELLRRSDEQLVELVLDGHDSAFDVLFDRHVADSLWYAREVLGSWGEAEEAVRHSFAAAHAYLATRGRETEFWPWLQTILGNYCLSMLQARTPGPERSAGDTVVDLGEWRLRRKLFGVALPAGPGLGIREGLMAVSGIGTGATAAGTPLLGGVAAKLAVVAVLAGGVGAAGGAASDRSVSADAGAKKPPVERTVDARGSRADGYRANGTQAAEGRRRRVALEDSDGGPHGPRELREGRSRDSGPAEPSPRESGAPDASGEVAAAPVAALDSATAQTPVPGATPVQSTLQHVADAVEEQVPAVAEPVTSQLSESVDLPKIGHDLGVRSVKPPVDMRAVLSRGKAVLPK